MQQLWPVAALAAALAWPAMATAQEGAVERALNQLDNLFSLPESSVCETVEDTTTAQQVIRLHTQLLLTSLACSEAYGQADGDLFYTYRQFTADHATEIIRAQDAIEAGYGSGDDAVRRFDAFRTVQANLEAQMLNDMGAGAYCEMRRARFDSLTGPDAVSFEGYADALAQRARAAAPRC